MAYIGKSPTGSGVRQRYVYTATGGETSLSGADDNSKTLKFTDGEYVDVHLNGVLLVQGTDYGVGTANTISSLAALAANDVVEITVYDVYNVAKINSEAMRNRWYFTATGGETAITTSEVAGLSFNANAEIEVRLNGVSLQQGTDFNTTTANQVGGLAALTSGQVVEIIHYADFQLADTVSKAAGGTFTGDVTFSNDVTVSNDLSVTGYVKPTLVAFQARLSADITGFDTTDFSTSVPYNTTDYNNGSAYNTSGSDIGLFVAPVAGMYTFDYWVYSSADTFTQSWLTKNGARMTATDVVQATAAAFVGGSATVKLASGDKVGVHPYNAGSSERVSTNSSHTYFRGILLMAV